MVSSEDLKDASGGPHPPGLDGGAPEFDPVTGAAGARLGESSSGAGPQVAAFTAAQSEVLVSGDGANGRSAGSEVPVLPEAAVQQAMP